MLLLQGLALRVEDGLEREPDAEELLSLQTPAHEVPGMEAEAEAGVEQEELLQPLAPEVEE